MNPTIAQMLVQDHQHALAMEAARVHLAVAARTASRPSRPGTSIGTSKWMASLASSLLAVVR